MAGTKKARRRGTVRARGTGKWEIVVSVKDPISGNHRKVSRVIPGTRREAEAALSALLVEVDSGGILPKSAPSSETYADLVDAWLDRKRAEGLSPSSLAAYSVSAKTLKKHLGHRKIDDLEVSTFDHLYSLLLRDGLSGATIRKVHQVARSTGALAVTYGLVKTNIAALAKPPKVIAPVKDAPEPEQIRELIVEATRTNPPLATFLRLGAATGARRGEICALRWNDLKLDAKTPTVLFSRTIVIGETSEVSERKVTKTGKARKVTLDPGTVEILKAHRERAERMCADLGADLLADGFVFSSQPDGSAIPRPDSYTWAFSKIADRLDIEVTLYEATRHYAASTMIGSGVDPVTAAARIGNDPNVLLKRYAHVRAGADGKAAALMGGTLD